MIDQEIGRGGEGMEERGAPLESRRTLIFECRATVSTCQGQAPDGWRHYSAGLPLLALMLGDPLVVGMEVVGW